MGEDFYQYLEQNLNPHTVASPALTARLQASRLPTRVWDGGLAAEKEVDGHFGSVAKELFTQVAVEVDRDLGMERSGTPSLDAQVLGPEKDENGERTAICTKSDWAATEKQDAQEETAKITVVWHVEQSKTPATSNPGSGFYPLFDKLAGGGVLFDDLEDVYKVLLVKLVASAIAFRTRSMSWYNGRHFFFGRLVPHASLPDRYNLILGPMTEFGLTPQPRLSPPYLTLLLSTLYPGKDDAYYAEQVAVIVVDNEKLKKAVAATEPPPLNPLPQRKGKKARDTPAAEKGSSEEVEGGGEFTIQSTADLFKRLSLVLQYPNATVSPTFYRRFPPFSPSSPKSFVATPLPSLPLHNSLPLRPHSSPPTIYRHSPDAASHNHYDLPPTPPPSQKNSPASTRLPGATGTGENPPSSASLAKLILNGVAGVGQCGVVYWAKLESSEAVVVKLSRAGYGHLLERELRRLEQVRQAGVGVRVLGVYGVGQGKEARFAVVMEDGGEAVRCWAYLHDAEKRALLLSLLRLHVIGRTVHGDPRPTNALVQSGATTLPRPTTWIDCVGDDSETEHDRCLGLECEEVRYLIEDMQLSAAEVDAVRSLAEKEGWLTYAAKE